MVVERGLARCPRCVSVADYAFIEYPRGMRYEVRCRKCGECYEEESRPSAALAPVPAPEPPIAGLFRPQVVAQPPRDPGQLSGERAHPPAPFLACLAA